jgi:hypothetical protein
MIKISRFALIAGLAAASIGPALAQKADRNTGGSDYRVAQTSPSPQYVPGFGNVGAGAGPGGYKAGQNSKHPRSHHTTHSTVHQ